MAQSVPFHPSPPIDCLQESVRQYHLQSPGHFELELEVEEASASYDTKGRSSSKFKSPTLILDVRFHGIGIDGSITVPAQCHLWRSSRKRQWECLTVSYNGVAEDLNNFLASNFPVIDAPVRPDTSWRWWLANGKSFNWAALPTELKERVIEHCMHQPPTYGVFSERVTRFHWRNNPNHDIRKPGPFEIVEQLGDWFHILYVSHQVRAIALRLCITLGGDLTQSRGLTIVAGSYKGLRDRIDRLGDYYQMTSSNSIPTSSAEQALSKCYQRFPKIYPHLTRFASLAHGIRKVSLSMDWLSFMHFFEVIAGGFERYYKSFKSFHKKKVLTFEVFERLPCLNEIVVRLPLRPYGGWQDKPGQCGPQLWHVDSPCPRAVHRVIYERVAEVLAAYSVTVRNFIDYGEILRYETARAAAVKALLFTKEELEELYVEDGGGVQLLEGQNKRSEELKKIRRENEVDAMGSKDPQDEQDPQDDYWPPLCHCDEPCMLARVLTARKYHS